VPPSGRKIKQTRQDLTVSTNHVAKAKVEQQGEECGFGHNVRAEGIFRKSAARNQSSTTPDARMLGYCEMISI
jgi:hypothetical protein